MKARILVVALLVLAGAGGGYYAWHQSRAEVPLVMSGNVDIREVNLSFRVGGRVAAVRVDEGDRVTDGQVVASLDAEPLREALAQARASLAAAQAAEALLRAGTRAEDLARLKAQVDALRAVVANTKATLERQQQLVTTSAASVQQLDNARGAYDQAQGEHEAARQAYLAALAGARPEEVQQAVARTAAAEAQVAAAALQVKDATLEAPSDGVVITRSVEPGTMVAAGTPVLTLSLDRPVRVRAYVDEPRLAQVAPGTKVLVFSDARPGRPYRGTVGFVSPRAEFTPKQVETQDLRTALVYRLRVVVDDPDDGLRQGMPVTVRLAGPAG